MSVNGKISNITVADLFACAQTAGIKKALARPIIEKVLDSREHWYRSAEKAEIKPVDAKMINAEIYRKNL